MADVSFPAFSEVVRSQITNLKQNYYRFLVVIASAAYFTSGFLMTSGQALINLLYDQRYADAGWMLEVLSATLLTVPFRLAGLSLLALGKPRLQSYALLVRLSLMLVCIPMGFRWYDIEGALAGYLISQFASIPIFIFYNFKYHLLDLRKELYFLVILPVGLLTGKLAALGLDWLHGQFG
jgi:O-antigen/teichoic acid export membrane protein